MGQCQVLCVFCLVRLCRVRFETPILPFFYGCFSSCWPLFRRYISAQLLDFLLFGSVRWSVEASLAVDTLKSVGMLPGLSSGSIVVVWVAGRPDIGMGNSWGGRGLERWLQRLVFWSSLGGAVLDKICMVPGVAFLGRASGVLCCVYLGVGPGSCWSRADWFVGLLVCSGMCTVLFCLVYGYYRIFPICPFCSFFYREILVLLILKASFFRLARVYFM